MYILLEIILLKKLERAPTFFPIDMSLSLRITTIFFNPLILLRASRECPFAIEASPTTTITLFSGSAKAIPHPADKALPA